MTGIEAGDAHVGLSCSDGVWECGLIYPGVGPLSVAIRFQGATLTPQADPVAPRRHPSTCRLCRACGGGEAAWGHMEMAPPASVKRTADIPTRTDSWVRRELLEFLIRIC